MEGFIREIELRRSAVPSFDAYPFNLPAVRRLERLVIHPKVTFLIGENGSGKSTLIEAIGMAIGFNAEGGSKNFQFATRRSESPLHQYLQVVRGSKRESDGFFLRAESFFNLATEVEALGLNLGGYGGRSLHEQSHGESFLSLATHRFRGQGVYVLDEPEAALSPSRQLAFLALLDEHVRKMSSQFIIATHSPILMAYPDATLYRMSETGIEPVKYEDTDHFRVTSRFLANREQYFRHLFRDE